MKLDVSKAFIQPMNQFPFDVEVELQPQDVNGDVVAFDTINLNGFFSMSDDIVTLEGKLKTVAHAPCARCTESVAVPVEVDFCETFRKDADEEEDGSFLYENKQLPLEHMTLTLVLLNMPMRFECGYNCMDETRLTAWNEQNTVWAEEEEEAQGTYRPFEGLKQMLEEEQRKQ